MPKRQETYRTVRAGLLIIWSLKRVREADPAKLICEANYSKLFAKQITFGIGKFSAYLGIKRRFRQADERKNIILLKNKRK